MPKKVLCKNKDDVKIDGVCSGIAKYFDMDPTVIRLLWVILTLAGGSGIIAYVVCMFVMPDDPGYTEAEWTDLENENNNS